MMNKIREWLRHRKPCAIDTADIELRPCQFCGGKAIFYTTNDGLKTDRGDALFYFSVECKECGAHPHHAWGKARVYMRQNGDFYINRDEMHKAAKVWNGEVE